ncbi:MAG TPA: trehalose-phosphatase [Actinomycetales bacterium]|nr:trehalose-phosphatase [Actinomycetales bacterium]
MNGFRPVTRAGSQMFDAVAADPAGTLVVSDFDGTLAPIVSDPTKATVLPAALNALERVGALVGHVALITGRDVETVRRLGGFEGAGFARLRVLGQYGVESWDAATGEVHLPPEPPEVRELLRELPSLLNDLGVHAEIEDKGRAVAVHTRNSPNPEATHLALARPLRRMTEARGLVLEAGRNVWEAKIGNADKGKALDQLLTDPQISTVVMCGDDLGDIPAFRAVIAARERGLAGANVVAVSVEQPSVAEFADVRCDGPAGVAAWLDALADRLEA